MAPKMALLCYSSRLRDLATIEELEKAPPRTKSQPEKEKKIVMRLETIQGIPMINPVVQAMTSDGVPARNEVVQYVDIGRPMGILEPLRMAASQIGLSDAQKEQIKTIAQSHADEWKGLADRERQGRQALRAAVSAPQFDEVTIRQRSAELGAAQAR